MNTYSCLTYVYAYVKNSRMINHELKQINVQIHKMTRAQGKGQCRVEGKHL